MIENRKQRGTVLLLSLIVMSSVVLSSMGLGTLIVNSLQQSRIIDNAVIAYYAAESSAEESLYSIRRLGIMPDTVDVPQDLGNDASWTRDVRDSELIVYIGTMPRDSFVEITLYDPETEVPSGAAVVDVTWEGTGVLASSLVGWQPGTEWEPDPEAISGPTIDYATSRTTSSPAAISLDSTDKLYRLRLRALDAMLDDVRVQAYADSGRTLPVELPGRVSIDARGSFGGTQQKLLVSLPRKTPLAGIYDYVVFSECSLVKGGASGGC